MFLDLTIDPGSSSEQLIEQITKHVTEKLSISLDENTTVLPQYLDQKTMLEKFLHSDLVKLIVEHREQEKALSREGSDQQDPRSLAEVAENFENTQGSGSLLLTEELTRIVKRTIRKFDSDSDVRQLSFLSKKPKLDR